MRINSSKITGLYIPIQPKPISETSLMRMKDAPKETIRMLGQATRRCPLGVAAVSKGPLLWAPSSTTRIARLRALEPNRSPIARLGAGGDTKATALMLLNSSGNEVANASRVTPIHTPPNPVLSAMMSPDFAALLPAMAMTSTHIENHNHTNDPDTPLLFYQ